MTVVKLYDRILIVEQPADPFLPDCRLHTTEMCGYKGDMGIVPAFYLEDRIMTITKQTTMGEMLKYDGGIAYVLMQSGMHCVGCPSSIMESLEEACMGHGLDSDEVLASINEYLASKAQ